MAAVTYRPRPYKYNRAMNTRPKPVALIILDGWGHSESPAYNAIAAAATPCWDEMWRNRPRALIHTSGAAVGLPAGQMGNSEVGHINLGAGRVVYQDSARIERAIKDGAGGDFFANAALTGLLDKAVGGGAVHIMGLLSDGGVHSDERHIHAMTRLAAQKGVEKIYLHAFTDGRDTPPQSALRSVARMRAVFGRLGRGRFASVVGRYFAMDRDRRWDRVKRAYDLIFHGAAAHRYPSAEQAIRQAYERGERDEFIQPSAIDADTDAADAAPLRVADGDALIFMNFRADRARQLSQAIIDDAFDGFERGRRARIGGIVSLTQYNESLPIAQAFPPQRLENTLGAYLAGRGLRQLRLAETEKYAHVTFFFNGGEEAASKGEERVLVPSPDVATYDLKPEMSAAAVTDKLVAAIKQRRHDLIVCNYANADMVGHTGNQAAAVKAVETIDACLRRVVDALGGSGGEALITADHGNAELLFDERTGQAHTAHTTNPVPLVYIGRRARLSPDGALSDISPTLLRIMDIEQPAQMTGRPLVEFIGGA